MAAVAVLVAVGAAVAVLLATSAGGSNGSYRVRAIFDDAGNIIPGEQVKIAGVKVGKVTSVTPTPQAKAAVVLQIDNDGFKDFREDAGCEIRP
ncbi:MAG TPA: MlaD family protein, partial [Solirubrobacteraceae bacterium]|nr:MlaD family protein [Solirubrobacteraceae bacterium]